MAVRVLNLVTNDEARFFCQQVATLERQGVATTTCSVRGNRQDGDRLQSRSVLDYLRFYPRTLAHSFDDYDLVHANYGLTAPAALAQPNLPVVVSLWGSDLFGRYGPVSRWCARRADATVVMSEAMADALGTDCHVVPHGVDLELFRPAPRAAAREAVGWRADAANVLFPYRAGREVKDYPRARRVVDAAAERLSADVELRTVHGIDHETMPVYLNAADALLLTSRHEGSPNSVKEAMACNLPVVATDVGDVRERLAGVEPSAVCRSDAELVGGLVEVLRRGEPSNGRERVRSVSTERTGERLRAVYESVVAR